MNFLKNRMSYSNYKHDNVFQVLLGEWSDHLVVVLAHLIALVVVSLNRLVLFCSDVYGGLSNEISILLDQSTLLAKLKGMEWWFIGLFIY